MPIQFPGARAIQNPMDTANRQVNANQMQVSNALVNDAQRMQNKGLKTSYDDAERLKIAREMKVMSERGQQMIQQGRPYESFRGDVADKFMEWDMDVSKIPQPGGDPREVMEGFTNLGQMADDVIAALAPQMQDIAAEDIPAAQRDPWSGEVTRTGAPNSGNARLDFFNTLSEYAGETGPDGQPTDRAKQAQTQLGTLAREGSSSLERIAGDEDLQSNVIDYRTELAGAEAFAKAEGVSRNRMIDAGAAGVMNIDANIRNLDRAYDELEAGAQSGPIISKYSPTVRAATVALEQTRAQLGLDVVGSVTFGALSKGELDMALAVALPNLPPEELKQWILDRKAAQGKLRDYYMEQINHLDNGGTVASFMRQQERKKGDPAQQLALKQAKAAIAAKPENKLLIIEKYVEEGYNAQDLF